MALIVRIKPRAQREIERAAEWWTENRLAARGAVRQDLEAAVALLVEEPGIGTKVETSRADVVRRLYLSRIRYFVYYAFAASIWKWSRSGIPAAKMVLPFNAVTPNHAVDRTPGKARRRFAIAHLTAPVTASVEAVEKARFSVNWI